MPSTTLTKADIVDNIYEQTNRNRIEVKDQVESLLSIMKEAYEKQARKGRNPQTNETITLPARKVVVFRISRKFRAEINPQE